MVGTGSSGLGGRHRKRCRPPRRGLTESPLPSLGAAEVVEDAADDAALGDEGDHPHHASAAGKPKGLDSVAVPTGGGKVCETGESLYPATVKTSRFVRRRPTSSAR